jgi:hypothetical protein
MWRLPLVAPKAENLAKIQTVLEALSLMERKPLAAASVPN